MSYEAESLDAVRQQIRTPPPAPKPEPKFSAWSLVTAVPRGIGEAGAQVMASGAEIAAAIKARGMQEGSLFGRPEADYQSDFADSLRDRGREFRPDPETAHAAEQVLYGFARGASKIVAGAVMAGPAGVVAAGGEEAMSAADDLKRQGVTDINVRTKAGLVQGAGLALAALPVVGQTMKATAALYAVGGPGGFMAQQALTRKILAEAGFDGQAAQFDPFDPLGLAMSSLIPLPFVAAGVHGQRVAAKAKAAEDFRAGPLPSEPTPAAAAVRDAYSPEVVDAARVAYAVEQRAAANPGARDMQGMDLHEQALTRAEDAMARGEPVQVADLVPEYWAEHRPMDDAGGAARLHDLEPVFGPDIYSPNALQVFGSGDAREASTVKILKRIKGNPDAEVTIYRGVPEQDMRIVRGDWVTLDKRVASEYGPNVISEKVPASHVTSWPDSLLEFGYFPPDTRSPVQAFAESIDSLRQSRTPDAAAQAQTTPPQSRAPEAAAPPQGNPRDLRAELIALRKESAVLSKLMECLNG